VGLLLVLGGVGWLYLRGWRRLRRSGSPLGSFTRLALFLSGSILLLAALFPPLYNLSHQFLYIRAIQKILVAMVAAPLLWLACPAHLVLRGSSFSMRRRIFRLLRNDSHSGQIIRHATSTGIAWITYVAAIVIWHDSHVVNWTMTGTSRHYLTLILIFGAALLYWVHIVGTGFRLRRALPGWVLFAYAVGVEIPNMTAGITIAYSSSPLYTHYAEAAAKLGTDAINAAISDQIMAGGLVWFMGSVVFFFSAVMLINRLFHRYGSNAPEHFPDWDSEERMIAPGLEHRLK